MMIILAGDIGGTHCRFRLINTKNGNVQIKQQFTLSSQEFDSAESMLLSCKNKIPQSLQPDTVCLAVAGPVKKNSVSLTNLSWEINTTLLKEIMACSQASLINDFTAVALAVSQLSANDYLELQQGKEVSGAPRMILGPGTGLGVSMLINHDRKYITVAGEAGHLDFAPQGKIQESLLHFLQIQFHHVSYERILSGPGIESLYLFCMQQAKGDPDQCIKAEQITRNASAGDAVAIQALNLFASILGAFAGNMALINLARGGVYIGGGIVPSILSILEQGLLIEAFCNKGRMRSVIESVPLRLINIDDAGLRGVVIHCLSKQ